VALDAVAALRHLLPRRPRHGPGRDGQADRENAMSKTVAILVFDDVEVLDFCGPFEAFSVAGFREKLRPFAVHLVAERKDVVAARNGLKVLPDHDLAAAPASDIVVVPGGPGARPAAQNLAILDWLRGRVAAGSTILSVCTGALVLGRAGLLDGLRVTTHHGAIDELRAAAPNAVVDPSRRYHTHERMVVAAGVASGIDGALELVARECGAGIAQSTADYMEYPWQRA
jgi:transcriptional regulator GlxA family with amidase domain